MSCDRFGVRVAFSCAMMTASAFTAFAQDSTDGAAPARTAAMADLADGVIARTTAFLRSRQDEATGGWSVNPRGPDLPAITGLVVRGMLMDPAIDHTDPAVARGIDYMLSFVKEDGLIHDGILPSYNTAICLSALALVPTDEARAAIEGAQRGLVSIQWGDAGAEGRPADRIVERAHPFYGGWGYGRSSRPDMSNTVMALQALHDSGLDTDSPAYRRALVFLSRTQMLDEVNDMPYAEGSSQGGFIYSTSPSGDEVGVGESKAGMIEESLSDGLVASRFRSYGSMTYAGFKSLIYAGLERDDPRVVAAYRWLRENFTVEENPGIGTDGYYYYLLMMARALDAWGDGALDVKTAFEGPEDGVLRPVRGRPDLAREPGTVTDVYDDDGVFVGRFRLVADLERSTLRGYRSTGRSDDGRSVEIQHLIRDDPGRRSSHDDSEKRVRVTVTTPVRWADALAGRLDAMQSEPGSFHVVDDRWMEDNEVLIGSYMLNALQHARQYVGAGETGG